MHNIKFIRNNPQGFKLLMEKRGLKIELEEIIDLDNLIRAYQTEIQEIQEKRNNTSKEIGKLVSQGHDIIELQKSVSNFKSELTELDEKIKQMINIFATEQHNLNLEYVGLKLNVGQFVPKLADHMDLKTTPQKICQNNIENLSILT